MADTYQPDPSDPSWALDPMGSMFNFPAGTPAISGGDTTTAAPDVSQLSPSAPRPVSRTRINHVDSVDAAHQQEDRMLAENIRRVETQGEQEIAAAERAGQQQIDLAKTYMSGRQEPPQAPQEQIQNIMAGAPWLFALTALGGVASKAGGLAMLESLNGVSSGLISGDQEAMARSWDKYNSEFQKWKARSDEQFKIYGVLSEAYGEAADGKMRAMHAAHAMTNDAYAAQMQADDPMTILKTKSELELNHARASEAYAKAAKDRGEGGAAGLDYDQMPERTRKVIDFYARQQMAGDTTWRTGLSRTKEGVALIKAVDMRVPALADMYGIAPEALSTTRDFRKSLDSALTDRQRNLAAASQFVNNFEKQTLLVEKYLGHGVGGATPVLNRWIQAGRKSVAGDDEVTQLDVALRGLAREHQRIVTGVTSNAQLHVESAKTGDELINQSMTAAQIRANMKVMLEEAHNAVSAGQYESNQMRQQLSQLGVAGVEAKGHKADAAQRTDVDGRPIYYVNGQWQYTPDENE